ncbi:MAG TPA: hypothetical protein VEJ63_03460 [Planctomycetota bacterium]|nr:hypothetical protein [Planctomycetota bacterium]
MRTYFDDGQMNECLKRLAALLEGGNYTVFLAWYSVDQVRLSPKEFIRILIGPDAKLASFRTITPEEARKTVLQCLTYRGDGGHGPDSTKINTNEFSQCLNAVIEPMGRLLDAATQVTEVFISEGHAKWTVQIFWGFGICIEADGRTHLFVGSAED